MKRAFVLMPSGLREEYEGGAAEAMYVYNEIITAAFAKVTEKRGIHFEIRREIDKRESGSINKKIIQNIVKADIVLVDITGSNPNVFLELGIRYSLRDRGTILIGQKSTEIPFDIAGYRCIRYEKFETEMARKEIAEAIENSFDSEESDSVVFDIYRDMQVIIPGEKIAMGDKLRMAGSVMPWSDYMQRIEYHSRYMRVPLVEESRFPLDAIIGISNGGLIAADLMSKRLRAQKPVLSLWAWRDRRGEGVSRYFSHEFADSAIHPLVTRRGDKGQPIGLLVIDDHMGTGETADQAIRYLEAAFEQNVRIIFLPLVCRRQEYRGVNREYLPFSIELSDGSRLVSEEDFWSNVDTHYDSFPYLEKRINRGSS